MFCEKCGAKIPDGASFCEKCGAPVGGAAAGGSVGGQVYTPVPAKPSAIKKFFSVKRNVILTAAAAALLVILIVVIAVIAALPKKVYVDKYFDIVYTGCDGYATPHVEWNDDALKKIDKKIFSKKVKIKNDELGLGSLLNALQENLSLKDLVSVTLDRENAYLSNGDKITVSVTPDFPEFEKIYKIKLALKHKTVTVKGLKAAVEFDPFAGVTVSYEGFSGYGRIVPEVPGSPVAIGDSGLTAEYTASTDGFSIRISNPTAEDSSSYYIRCTFERTYNLSNGDTVTCTVQDADNLVSVMGVALTAKEKAFTLDGFDGLLSYDPSKEVSVAFSGFSGFGDAAVQLPDEKKIGNYIIRVDSEVTDYRLRIIVMICDESGNQLRKVHYDADKTEYFANSDTVTFTLNTSGSSLEQDYGITFAETFAVTVSGLDTPVNPKFADHLSVVFEGFEGYGRISSLAVANGDVYTIGKYTFKLTSTLESGSIFGKCSLSVVVADETGNLFTVEYRADSYRSLKENGSVVSFRCRTGSSERERIAREYGIALPESLDYTVSGLKATTKVDPREMLSFAFSGENGKIKLDFGLKQAEMTAGGYTIALSVESGESWGNHETTLNFIVTAEDGTVYTGRYYAYSGSLSEGDKISLHHNISVDSIAEATGLVFETETLEVIVSTK